jgi:hypothetical protein
VRFRRLPPDKDDVETFSVICVIGFCKVVVELDVVFLALLLDLLPFLVPDATGFTGPTGFTGFLFLPFWVPDDTDSTGFTGPTGFTGTGLTDFTRGAGGIVAPPTDAVAAGASAAGASAAGASATGASAFFALSYILPILLKKLGACVVVGFT